MKRLLTNLASRCFALLAALALALAVAPCSAQAQALSQPELEQMLAPVALYPDVLLSQILVAAAYPADLIEAARWTETHAGIPGDAAVREAENEPWDPSVKALVAFPQVLAQMTGNLQWVQALGDAFVTQQYEVLDAVQVLRHRAQAAGSLRPDDQIEVVESGPDVLLLPRDPEVVYVPYYDPLLVYGPWWWPNYPPVYLRPLPGHFARPASVGLSYRGPPVIVSARIFDRGVDFRRRRAGVPPRPADARANQLFRTQVPAEKRTPQVHKLPPTPALKVNGAVTGGRREAPRALFTPMATPRAVSVRPTETAQRVTPAVRPIQRERAAVQVPRASAPRAEIRAPAPVVGRQTGTRAEPRWKMQP